jgi:Glycoside-hydrolase family GH114
MLARRGLSVTKGCDGVDPDNVDGYDNDNGLGLTQASALDYINFLTDTAHMWNLSIGLKNAREIIPDIIDKMEWWVQEQCIRYDKCDSFRPFLDQGKPVFHVEYQRSRYEQQCFDRNEPEGFNLWGQGSEGLFNNHQEIWI